MYSLLICLFQRKYFVLYQIYLIAFELLVWLGTWLISAKWLLSIKYIVKNCLVHWRSYWHSYHYKEFITFNFDIFLNKYVSWRKHDTFLYLNLLGLFFNTSTLFSMQYLLLILSICTQKIFFIFKNFFFMFLKWKINK